MLLFDLSHYTAKERRSFDVSLFTDLIIFFYDLYRGNLSGRPTFRVTIRFDCSSRIRTINIKNGLVIKNGPPLLVSKIF